MRFSSRGGESRTAASLMLFVLDMESVEIANELRGPRANLLRCAASGCLLQGCTDLGDAREAVSGTGSLHVVAQDADVVVIHLLERHADRLDVAPPICKESGN